MRPAEVCQFCQLDDTCRTPMRSAMHLLQLLARAHQRMPMMVRTIADLAGCELIQPAHLAEVL